METLSFASFYCMNNISTLLISSSSSFPLPSRLSHVIKSLSEVGKSPLVELCKISSKVIDFTTTSKKYDKEPSITSENDDNLEIKTSKDAVDNIPGSNTKKGNRNSVMPRSSPMHIYAYKILEADLLQVAQVMGLENDIGIIDDISTVDAMLVLSSKIKQKPWICSVAKYHKLPVFVIKENTST